MTKRSMHAMPPLTKRTPSPLHHHSFAVILASTRIIPLPWSDPTSPHPTSPPPSQPYSSARCQMNVRLSSVMSVSVSGAMPPATTAPRNQEEGLIWLLLILLLTIYGFYYNKYKNFAWHKIVNAARVNLCFSSVRHYLKRLAWLGEIKGFTF